MESMFNGSTLFNQNISGWNVLLVTGADYIFCNCPNMLITPAYQPTFIGSPILGC
jgi:hypothetical protein